MKYSFTVYGKPVGKGRPRYTMNHRPYTPKETVEYEKQITRCFQQQCSRAFFPEGTAIDMRITAYYPTPSSYSKKKKQAMRDRLIRPLTKPDADNIYKIVADALNKVAYHDDSQIADAQIRKFYSDEPRLVITIQEAKSL